MISVRSVGEKCGPVVSSALFSLHAFTGCDSVCCFKGKGKIKSFKLMKETEEFGHTFKFLGCDINLTKDLFQQLETFCAVYLDREMFLLLMLLISRSFKQLANLIVHYHLAKIVIGYTQEGQNSGLLFGVNVFTSILMLPLQKLMARNVKIRD